MVDFKISVRGMEQALRRLASAPRKIRAQFPSRFRDIGFFVQTEARRRAPRDQQDLERSIDFQVHSDDVQIYVPINSPAGKYAKVQHDKKHKPGKGTRAKGISDGRFYIKNAILGNRVRIHNIMGEVFRTV